MTKLEQQNAELVMLLEDRDREIAGLRWVHTAYHPLLGARNAAVRVDEYNGTHELTSVRVVLGFFIFSALAEVKSGPVSADDLISTEAHGARIAELSKKVSVVCVSPSHPQSGCSFDV